MSETQRDGSEMRCKRCGANECRIHGFCSVECEHYFDYEEEITDLEARIAELEEENRLYAKDNSAMQTAIDKFYKRAVDAEARIAELESAQRWTPVQDIKVGEIYLIDGYDEWDSDRGTEVLDGFTIAKYYGIEDSCRVFADFYGTFLRFDMESDDLRNVYRLPEGE